MAHFIKDGVVRSATGIYTVKDNVVLSITNVYDYVAGKTRLLWTIVKDIISNCFSAGYWINEERWVNEDAWSNGPQ